MNRSPVGSPALAARVETVAGRPRRLLIRSSNSELKSGPPPGVRKLPAISRRDWRAQRAARWVLEMNGNLAARVHEGREVAVDLPNRPAEAAAVAHEETVAAYRRLRQSPGRLVRPWLLGPLSLDRLYPFQRQGVEWLLAREGAVLADDMGLGKTVQAIFAMRLLFSRAEIRGVLVACPKSLLEVWERELVRWAPELGVAILSPPARIREQAWSAVVGRRHVLMTNYEQLREPPKVLLDAPLDLMVADEAHRLRNFGAQVTAGVDGISRRRFWALSGTPLERDLEDLATLLSLIEPSRFAPGDSRLHPSSLRSAARSYVLRRRKDEVLKELPPVVDSTEKLDLNAKQAEAYAAAVAEYRRRREPGLELALLTRLRGLCDIDQESGSSSKLDWILERLTEIEGQGDKAVVFAYRLAPLHELERRISARWGSGAVRRLVGSMDSEERRRAVQDFRTRPDVLALAASSRVGGEGLTLVEANHVFLLDQWWNPSANDQARDRVVRIGQKRTVHVYRFCCRGTIEERLQEILELKRELFEDAVGRLDVGAALKAIVRKGNARTLVGGLRD